MSLSRCRDILSECAAGERVAHAEYLLDGDIEVLDLRMDVLHDYTLLRLGGVYPVPAGDFIRVRVYLMALM